MIKCALTDGNKSRLVPQFAKIFLNSNLNSAESAGNILGEFLFANFDENNNSEETTLNITNQEQIIQDTLKLWVQLMQMALGNSPENERLLIKLKSILDNADIIANTAINYAKQKYQGDGESSMEIQDGDFFNIVRLVEFSTLNDLYGTAQQARTEMLKMLRSRLIATLFVDFKNGRIIKNQELVNVGIVEWQQELVDNIIQYAKAKGINSDIKLFENGVYNNLSFTLLLTLAQDLFKDFNSTKLNNIFGSRMLPLEGMALLAYNSWVILNNFDMLVKNLLGKTITINEAYMNSFLDADKNKYSLNDGSNLVKTWRTSEDINAIDELGSVTKLLLDSAPIYNFDNSLGLDLKPQLLFGRELTTADVAYAFAKVREHPTFRILALAIRYNPMIYVPELIEAALAPSTRFDEDTQNIKNILFSVYKRFFQLHKTANDSEYSLTEIMNSESKTSNYTITNNLLSYITGMIDKTVPNNHVEYAVDADTGRITPRFSSTSSLENYKYTVLKNIDNLNNTLDSNSRLELLDTFELKHTGQGGHIKTKWNIEYTFGGRKYRIEFDNTHRRLLLENLKVEYEVGGKKDFIDYKSYPNQLEVEEALIYLLDKTLFINLSNKPELVDTIVDLSQNVPNLPNGEKDRVSALAKVSLLSSRVLLKHRFDTEKKYNDLINNEYGTRKRDVWFDKRTGKVKATLMDNLTNELLKLLAKSQMIINGEVVKSTIRNLEGNSVAAEGLTNYINNIRTTWLDAEFLPNSAISECVFTLNPDLLSTITLKGSALTSDKLKVKPNKDFNVAEAGYSSVMKDFLLGFMLTKDSDNEFTIDSSYDLAFQPTVTSDKTTNPLININKNAELQTVSGDYKKIIDMTTLEILDIHFITMGRMYTKMKLNITADYNLFFRQVSHTPLLEVLLRNAGINPNGTYTYEQFRDIIFPIINNFANSDNTAGTLFQGRSAVEVFNDIVSANSSVVVNIHNVGKKNLETNPVLDYHYRVYNDQALFLQQVYKNQGRFIKDCIESFKIYWKDELGNIDEEIQGAVARLKQQGIVTSEQNFVDNWVEPDTLQMILAKVNGKPIFKRDADLIIPGAPGLEINPIFEAFYAHDLMFSVQFVTSTVGGCYGHKNNFKSTNLTPGTIEYMEEEEAGRVLTQFKRMVIYPATTHVYQQELLEGCATQIKVALALDIGAPVYNFLDDQDDIDAHDGSGECTPWASDWENGSLGDAKAGTDKKTIGHNMNHLYLMGTEFKWALFAITNEKVVNSGKNTKGVNLRQVMENMTDIEWDTAGREFDITKTYLGDDISLLEFGKRIIFKATELYNSPLVIPGRHYEVKGLIHTGHNLYTVLLLEVNNQGLLVGDIFNVENVEINSNFKLWNVFGAEFSEEVLEDPVRHTTKLIPSDSSSKLVTFFGNNTGYLRASDDPNGIIHPELAHQESELEAIGNRLSGRQFYRTTEELRKKENLTLRDVYLPMKYSDISYIVNPSAVKNGQINVNPKDAWYKKTKLRHFTVSTKHFGVLMDADHHADDAELTEMSLVISALESNGYTHHIAKQAYQDLGAIVEVLLRPYIDAIASYYLLGDRKALYEVVGKAFLNSFTNTSQDRADLADRLVYNLKKLLGDKLNLTDALVFIPFSDNTVLSKAISAITSQINKSAIKRKYAGIAAVMIPAYDLIKIYKTEDGIDSTFRGLVNRIGTPDDVIAQLEKQTLEGPSLSSHQIRLGKTYRNLTTGEVITLDTLPKYYAARDDTSVLYKEDFTVGRNLLPARTSFQLLNNPDEVFDIYDSVAVKNRLDFSRWYVGYKKASNKLDYLATTDLGSIINNAKYFQNDLFRLVLKIQRTTNPDYITVYVKQIGEYFKLEVVEAFRDLHQQGEIWIDGIDYKILVDKSTIQQEEAELVLSKIYATKYGLTTGVNLNDINEEWFRNQIEGYLKPTNILYDIALKRSNGVHTYLVLKNHAGDLIKQGLQKVEVKTDKDHITGKVWRKDPVTGKKLMPFDDCELYKGADGTEYIVTDNIELFINHKEYESIQINDRTDPNAAFLALNTLSLHNDSRLLRPYKNAKNALEVISTQAKREEEAITRAAKRKWTSFQKSLEFTAARIPSLSMLSYMPMKVVGFTDSEENKAYVSHFLAFLLGSDYDIDKVYLLGNEFDDDGMYIGWSPLFNLTDIKLQKACEELPMPTGKTIIISNGKIDDSIDCSDELFELIKIRLNLQSNSDEIDSKIEEIKAYVKLLEKINNSDSGYVYVNQKDGNNGGIFITNSTGEMLWIGSEDINNIEKVINKHLTYFEDIDDDLLLKMTKNSVSSKIRRIINDPLNMVAAYSPIEMNAPREAAGRSTMGSAEREYTMMNPTTKWHMRELNMVGKTAIGITAVGEKVLFALLHYYNEVAQMDKNSSIGKAKLIRAFFDRRIPLMKGSLGEKINVVRNIIANVNLHETDTIWAERINNEIVAVELSVTNGSISQEQADLLTELLLMLISVMADSALVNSALLSAATDNAKELILSKINANPDMLKIYTYCITLGIDFNTIADLMTSPTVTIINNLSKSNIFVLKDLNRTLDSALKIITSGYLLLSYGLYAVHDNRLGEAVYNETILAINGDKKANPKIESFWEAHFKGGINEGSVRLAILDLNKIRDKFKVGYPQNTTTDYMNMMRYFDDTLDLLYQLRDLSLLDFIVFKLLLEYGEELNKLGRILGVNQGIKTNMVDKIAYLDNLEDAFDDRLSKYSAKLTYEEIITDKPYLQDYVTKEEYNEILDTAVELGLLNSDRNGYISNFNALRFLLDEEYQEVAILLYDFIKGTVNILDVITTVPHYKAMTKAAAVDFTLFEENSAKFALSYDLALDLDEIYPRLNKKQKTLLRRNVSNFLLDVMTSKYFEDRGVMVNITGGYFNDKMLFIPGDSGVLPIDLSTPHGQASFKYWFENIVVPRLKRGLISDTSTDSKLSIIENKFISDLLLTTSNRTLSGDLKYLWTLPMNMSSTRSISDINNFVSYLAAFTDLELYSYNGIPVVRLFSYYNLITYKNQYGQDSLTRIFENYMVLPGNEMQDYFDYIGYMDYNRLLSEIDFSKEDLYMACALEVNAKQLSRTRQFFGPYVKVWNRETGSYDLYKYDKDKAKSYSNDEEIPEEALEDAYPQEAEDDNSPVTFVPLVYSKVTLLSGNVKKQIMAYFPYIAANKVKIELDKKISEILINLYNLGKILIHNNCG